MSGLRAGASLLSILIGASLPGAADAREYGSSMGQRRTGAGFGATAPGVLYDALAPTVQRWYVPQELYSEFQWRQWEHTNYSSSPYMRYVNTNLEGDFFYDFFGDYVSHGWLVYDWRQDQPQGSGSAVFKGNQFETWFSSVAISSDARGQNAYALTAGNRIRAGLTPMTFSKPTFNGVQFDFTSDKYAATLIASRISDPGQGVDLEPERLTSTTGLIGGRVTSQIGDFVTVGATLVDARNSNTALDMFEGDFFAGSLTGGQSREPVELITVVLSDDSPQDGAGGASLFSHDILITTRDFDTGEQTVFVLEQVVREGSEWPAIFGGLPKTGFLAADGEELIVLNYDFRDPGYDGPDPTEIVGVEFDYVLANDYKVEVWSNRQTGTRANPTPPLDREKIRAEEPALIALLRAPGNVSDKSNIRRVRFDYGLPTGNLVGGFTIEGTDLLGFDLYAEWDRNVKYAQFPNAGLFNARLGHETTSRSADAWYLTVSRVFHPFFLFGEGYSFHHDYSTSAFVVDAEGNVEYDNTLDYRYEFVDDNDDQDRLPDWSRSGSLAGDRIVFPGWDANNDFISDFNQNDNSSVANEIPDYEEPFLRHEVDRPEFLFGPDLNNNGWIDRFEDDELPDYPYKTDRQGYNAYLGTHLASGRAPDGGPHGRAHVLRRAPQPDHVRHAERRPRLGCGPPAPVRHAEARRGFDPGPPPRADPLPARPRTRDRCRRPSRPGHLDQHPLSRIRLRRDEKPAHRQQAKARVLRSTPQRSRRCIGESDAGSLDSLRSDQQGRVRPRLREVVDFRRKAQERGLQPGELSCGGSRTAGIG